MASHTSKMRRPMPIWSQGTKKLFKKSNPSTLKCSSDEELKMGYLHLKNPAKHADSAGLMGCSVGLPFPAPLPAVHLAVHSCFQKSILRDFNSLHILEIPSSNDCKTFLVFLDTTNLPWTALVENGSRKGSSGFCSECQIERNCSRPMTPPVSPQSATFHRSVHVLAEKV